ncbi:MAG: hypothetical protein ACQESR_17390, partial [Planctomycetota bacterium]
RAAERTLALRLNRVRHKGFVITKPGFYFRRPKCYKFRNYAAMLTAFSKASSAFLLPRPDSPIARNSSRMLTRRRVVSMSRKEARCLVRYQGKDCRRLMAIVNKP